MIVSTATNPVGAQQAGPWGVTTMRIFDGEYYIVDQGLAEESFYALPGFIRCGIKYAGVDMTFTPDAEFNFEFETEHNVPENGFIKMTLPKEMAFPQEVIDNKDVKLTV